jgi:Na+/H+ antiporter NhaB
VRLGYVTMLWMALPYAITMSIVGYFATTLLVR